MEFDIVGGFNQEPYAQFDGQRLVNMYVEIDPEAKKPKALVKDPGFKLQLQPPEGSVVRELFKHREYLYAVISGNVYRIDSAFTPTKINSALPLSSSIGYMGIAANQANQILFVDGTGGYLYKSDTSEFLKISDTYFPANPTACIYLDGYFIVNNAGTNQFYLSNPNDGESWALEGAAREAQLTSKPDSIIGFAVLQRRLFIFGQTITEVWYDAGAPRVPFRRDNNMLLEYGCASAASIATGHELLFWLSSTDEGVGPIVMTDGTRPRIISTRPLEEKIQGYGDVSNAIGYLYKIAGHLFYDLIFPSTGRTWTYDVNTQLWHEKEALKGERYIANCHAYFGGKHLIGAYNSRNIYELSESYYDHDGTPFKWLRTTRHLSEPSYKRIQVRRIQLDTVKGKAAANGVDATPEIFLSASRNGGVTFSSPQRKTYTHLGAYKSRAIWWNQGISDDWVFTFEGYNSQPFMILGGAIEYEVMRS